jgi:hypothetical protein
VGEVGFASRAARDVRLAACAVGEAFMVDEAFAAFMVARGLFAPFTVREAIAPSAVGEATAPLMVREAIAVCALGAAPTRPRWTT